MTTEIIIPTSEQHWLQMRTQDITSTDVAALFNLSPYKTEFELFYEKLVGEVVKIEPNERMRWGNRLESAIAQGVAEDQGWQIQPLKVYMRDPEARMGSSFDFEIIHPEHGKGIMEIKNVDGLVYRKNWNDDGNGNIEAPEHIELQVQHQMDVSGYEWCAIVAMVNGNTAKVAFRRRDPIVGHVIRQRVADFWKRIEKNEAPSPDYTRDAEFIDQLYSNVEAGKVYDGASDATFTALVDEYQQAVARREAAITDANVAKAKILERVGTAERAIGSFGSINLSKTKNSLGTLVTPEMVGTYVGARSGYRQFKITFTTPKE